MDLMMGIGGSFSRGLDDHRDSCPYVYGNRDFRNPETHADNFFLCTIAVLKVSKIRFWEEGK